MNSHWETVFQTKTDDQKSWFEEYPRQSMRLIEEQALPKDAPIIDVGGGDSRLVDALLEADYTNLTVVDISETALQNAKQRLGARAEAVKWIATDICDFEPQTRYAVWHDRAAFHFLTDAAKREQYRAVAQKAVDEGGKLIVGTFSLVGPERCSNLPVQRYNAEELRAEFSPAFVAEKCERIFHLTPFQTSQTFTFCVFCKDAT